MAFSNIFRPANLPKPNTRFLRNIIKGTDSHNRALLAKEAAESKARLKRLERTEDMKRKKTNPSTKDIRERHMGDIQAILGGGRRRRRDNDKHADTKEPDNRNKAEAQHKSRTSKDEGKSKDDRQESRRKSRSSPDRARDSSKHHDSRREDKRRSRHRDHPSDDECQSRRHRYPRDGRSRSPRGENRSKRTRSRDSERRRHRQRSATPTKKENPEENEEIDEIGPAPPPKIRGRGAVGASSGIDRRFSESYDPKTDMQGDDDNA